jgi:hypothetical protein
LINIPKPFTKFIKNYLVLRVAPENSNIGVRTDSIFILRINVLRGVENKAKNTRLRKIINKGGYGIPSHKTHIKGPGIKDSDLPTIRGAPGDTTLGINHHRKILLLLHIINNLLQFLIQLPLTGLRFIILVNRPGSPGFTSKKSNNPIEIVLHNHYLGGGRDKGEEGKGISEHTAGVVGDKNLTGGECGSGGIKTEDHSGGTGMKDMGGRIFDVMEKSVTGRLKKTIKYTPDNIHKQSRGDILPGESGVQNGKLETVGGDKENLGRERSQKRKEGEK